MSTQVDLWIVGNPPTELNNASISESELEEMIVAQPRLFAPENEWMLIGRQERTDTNGFVDLVALAPDGIPIIIELKKGCTPRDVVAQILDYACWAEKLTLDDLLDIYRRFTQRYLNVERELVPDFQERFKINLADVDYGENKPKLVIIASVLDNTTKRIISYLGRQGVPVNALDFRIFAHGEEKILSRSWLRDPASVQADIASSAEDTPPWNGEFYCTFGDDLVERSWEDAREYGFISAGGGAWYSRTLNILNPGDRVWVKLAWGGGYVGVGRVVGRVIQGSEFTVNTQSGEKRFIDVASRANYHKQYIDNPDMCEYFVPVEWIQTRSRNEQVNAGGLFGNQNSICRPRAKKWRDTIEYLKPYFSNVDFSK